MVIYAVQVYYDKFINLEEDLNLGVEIANSYSFAMGNLEVSTEWSFWIWIVTIIFSITLMIIMFNMLISIIGITFEKFRDN